MSIFSLYRVIKIDGVLKLNTITDPYSGDQLELRRGGEFLSALAEKNLSRFPINLLKKEYGLLALETASPSGKSSWTGWITDVHLLKNAGLDVPLRGLLQEFKQFDLLEKFDFFLRAFKPTRNISRKENESQGQLACKLEPAGKVRVFALVDV